MISASEWVLLEFPDGFQRIVQLVPNSRIELGKAGRAKADEFFGKPYESVYGLQEGKLTLLQDTKEASLISGELLPNDSISDTNTAQRLSHEEIVELREQVDAGSLSPAVLIDTLIENSDTFQKKNAFAQVKYRKRKEAKFGRWVRVRRCSRASLCMYYMARDPERIGHLRLDSLGQLLCLGNVLEGQRSLIWDNTKGLVLGAAASMNQSGMTIAVYDALHFQPHLYEHFNLPETLLYPIHFSLFSGTELEVPREDSSEKFMDKHKRRVEALEIVRNGNCDSLMIALTDRDLPEGALDKLLSSLRPSSAVVIFSPFRELLSDRFADWLQSPRFVHVQLSEPWMREYQTEAGRCHPMMSMIGHGGYLLSGYLLAE